MHTDLSIMIVDDEKLARDLLRKKLLEFGYTQIQEAANGAEALCALDARIPDVIFADIMMAQMDGLELLKAIRQRNLDLIYVLVSGYEIFNYAREAMRYSVFYYLLKPTEDQELTAVLSAIEQELQKRRLHAAITTERSAQSYRSRRALCQQYLEKLVFQPQSMKELNCAAQETNMGLCFVSDSYALVLCQIADDVENHPFGDTPALFFCIENIAQELLGKQGFSCYGFPTQKDYCLLCSIPVQYLPYEQHQQTLCDIFRETEAVCGETLQLSVTISIGLASGRAQLPSAFSAAQKSAQWKIQTLMAQKRNPYAPQSGRLDLTPEQEQRFFEALDGRDTEQIAAAVRNIYAPFFHQLRGQRSALNNLNLQMIMLLFKYLRCENEDSSALGEEFDLYQEVSALSREQDVLDWITDKAMRCVSIAAPQATAADDHTLALRIRRYLEQTYSQQLTLVSISEYFHFSPSHFSRLFKKEFGTTFVKYLLDYRIQEAQRLLVTTDTTVSAIGKRVGFHDPKHFYKVFKHATGFQPSAYRERFQKAAPTHSNPDT